MKKLILILLTISFSFSEAQNTWVAKASIPNGGAGGAVSFSIGNYGYVCTGGDSSLYYSSHTWRYDGAANSWMQMSDVGSVGRLGAVGFAVNGYGYVCSGVDDGNNLLSDVWQYNPSSNTWVQKGNFPGPARMWASAFVIGNRAYVTCGATDSQWTNYTNDLWEYNPATDSWTQRTSFPGAARGYAMSFSVGAKGYVGGGTPDDIFTFLNNYWQYDTTDVWSPIASFPGTARGAGVGFSLGDYGFVSTGTDDNVDYKDLWKYNPVPNTWYQRATFTGVRRDGAFSFVINNKAYIGGGEDANANLLSGMWMYTADSITTGVEQILSNETPFVVYPNPARNVLNVECNIQSADLTIYDSAGRELMKEKIHSGISSIHPQLAEGIYFIKVMDGEKVYTQKLMIE